MDKAYEDDKTISLAKAHGFNASFILKKIVNYLAYTINSFTNNKIISNDIFKIEIFRKVFTRYDKLDSIFIFNIFLAFIFDLLFI